MQNFEKGPPANTLITDSIYIKQLYISHSVYSGRIVKPGELESLHYYSLNNSGKIGLLYKNNITGIFHLL